MGIILGSVALGVLFGYPLGGFLYDFVRFDHEVKQRDISSYLFTPFQ